MPLPSDIRAERMDGRPESDWIITGEVGGQRIELARVPYKGPAYDHAALAVCMAAGERMLSLHRTINRIASPNPERTFDGVIRDLSAITDFARAAIQSATTIPTTDEGGR